MLISRRAAVVRGVVTFAGLYAASSAGAATLGVSYRLQTGPHCSCRACHHHAANKLFSSRAAADRGRAHAGCKCTIVRSRAVNAVQWQALFGHARAPRHASVDRRWASTRRALRHVDPAKRKPKPTHGKTSRR